MGYSVLDSTSGLLAYHPIVAIMVELFLDIHFIIYLEIPRLGNAQEIYLTILVFMSAVFRAATPSICCTKKISHIFLSIPRGQQ
ncbi:hypothetical protein SUGI_0203180 [Cryptomeria japonica]|nr:hypothetical protein SUGI_0203180 [Cryptomeria japonica]